MPRRLLILSVILLCIGFSAGCAQLGRSVDHNPGSPALAACDGPPSCVVSRDDAGERRVEPLRFHSSPGVARLVLLHWLVGQEGVEVVTANDEYIHAVFVTPLLRYRDDMQFLISAENDGTRVDVRSASRIGWYDWNANRNRVERMRRELAPALR